VICVVSMDWIYICSLFLHVLTVFTYAHCLYICLVANDVTFDFILITIEIMFGYQWCCFVLNFCQFWTYALVSMKFWMLHNMSTCIVFVFSALFGLWWNCPTLEIIWDMSWWSGTCEELGIITSPAYCLYRYAHYFYDAFMLQVLDQMMIDMFWDLLSLSICSLCLYMVTVFIYAHCLNICSLSLHMLTVFTYAYCFDICSLFLYMLTKFIYAHWVYIRSLYCLYTLTIFTYAHCIVYIRSLFLHMLIVFICGHCLYICPLSLHMLTEFTYAHCFDICSLFLYMFTVFICGHCFYICSLSLHMLTVLIYAHWVYICSLFWYMLTVFIYAHCFDMWSLFLYMRSLECF
jgi:hypothetical protein